MADSRFLTWQTGGVNHAAITDLETHTLSWAMQWWDHDAHMVWNPPGSMDENTPHRMFHLVPNTAWLAYGLLRRDQPRDRDTACAAIDALLALQYNEPGTAFHGTFAQFLESRHPPLNPIIWIDYDPNWRQFVGTTFALILEDFSDAIGADREHRVEQSIALAVTGEIDGRIPAHYTNPGLMRSWLDAWWGRRIGNETLVARGISFAREIVALHDRHDAFDEFNSPTYYGIDGYALALWEVFSPTPWFRDQGARIRGRLWEHIDAFYNPVLHNFCGPFTRSYHPDATRSVALIALWQWARFGRAYAPLPDLEADGIDHCHDLMVGPVIARLASALATRDPHVRASVPRAVMQTLGNGRTITAAIDDDLMIGAESSDNDWGGWSQFMPAVAHDRAVVLHLTMPTMPPMYSRRTLHIGQAL